MSHSMIAAAGISVMDRKRFRSPFGILFIVVKPHVVGMTRATNVVYLQVWKAARGLAGPKATNGKETGGLGQKPPASLRESAQRGGRQDPGCSDLDVARCQHSVDGDK